MRWCGTRCLALWLTLLPGGALAEVLERSVSGGADDAEEASGGGVSLTGSDLELVEDASLQTVGLRWTGVAIPPGFRVTAAWVQLRTDETSSGAATLTLQAEATPDAAPFATASGSISSRARTAASVVWSPPTWSSVGEAGPGQRTPDLSALIQTVVDEPDWESGNALALIVTGTGRRTADSFEGGFGPRLHVEFEPPADFRPQLSITSPPASFAFVAGEPVAFAAEATDVEDGDLAAAVAWASDRDGALGSGSPLVRADLSIGVHQITASVADSGGQSVVRHAPLLVTAESARILAAGDVASCGHTRDEETANLLDGLEGIVLTLGDNAYPNGTAAEFANCYAPSWGRHRARTRPAAGNHDFNTPGATGYFGYFGAVAGPAPQGWYSWDYGGWHFVALNSNCSAIGGCTRGSPQGVWLAADLEAHPSRCTLAYWHHPRFSSSTNHGSSTATRELWAILQEHGADVVLVGHDHLYERFAPQNADGLADPLGIREFLVGTGGAGLYAHGTPEPNSEVRDATSYGVLSLELAPDAYAWRFHPATALGGGFTDTGVASCVVHAPVVSIASPVDGGVFARGASISFSGTASDVEEGDLSAELDWTSSRGGSFAGGAAFTSSALVCGDHVVTASVRDLHGQRREAQVTVRVGPEGCSAPVGCGLGPELALVLAGLGLAIARRHAGSRPRRTR